MTAAPEGSDRRTRAAYLRWEGKGFQLIADCLGYASADEAEADFQAFMEERQRPDPNRHTVQAGCGAQSDVDDAVCGATVQLPPEFVETERRVTGVDWEGVTVACVAEPHPGPDHVGPLLFDGERHGVHYWTAQPP